MQVWESAGGLRTACVFGFSGGIAGFTAVVMFCGDGSGEKGQGG
jgi:hypothetical protein